MKVLFLSVLLHFLLLNMQICWSQVLIQSDGSDGVLEVSSKDIEIDLSKAVTGRFSENNAANAGDGIYDPEKWAVVFKYESVTIAAGRTVRFINHPSRAPVVWLVKSNVVILGTLSLNGVDTSKPEDVFGNEPGPGGFRGIPVGPLGLGEGFGPFGGANSPHRRAYGNPMVIPLLGGSGGNMGLFGQFGGGGGGAILIAAVNRVTIDGAVTALGGTSAGAGAIRIVCDELTGNGRINAGGGQTEGWVRIEANRQSGRLIKTPDSQRVLPGNPPLLWPSADAPTARIIRVHDQLAPSDPLARIDDDADISLQRSALMDVEIETTHFPTSGKVQLRVGPKVGAATKIDAVWVSGDASRSLWRASTSLKSGYSVLQAHAFVAQ